jgi:hypothetical protein
MVSTEHPDHMSAVRRTWIGHRTVERLPSIQETAALGLEALAVIKLYVPDSDWAAYIAGSDGSDVLYGLLTAPQIRLKAFHLSGLILAHSRWGIPIRRARNFQPKTLRDLQAEHEHILDLRVQRIGQLNVAVAVELQASSSLH